MTIQFTITDSTGLYDKSRRANVKVDNLNCPSDGMDFANALVKSVEKFTADYLKGESNKKEDLA